MTPPPVPPPPPNRPPRHSPRDSGTLDDMPQQGPSRQQHVATAMSQNSVTSSQQNAIQSKKKDSRHSVLPPKPTVSDMVEAARLESKQTAAAESMNIGVAAAHKSIVPSVAKGSAASTKSINESTSTASVASKQLPVHSSAKAAKKLPTAKTPKKSTAGGGSDTSVASGNIRHPIKSSNQVAKIHSDKGTAAKARQSDSESTKKPSAKTKMPKQSETSKKSVAKTDAVKMANDFAASGKNKGTVTAAKASAKPSSAETFKTWSATPETTKQSSAAPTTPKQSSAKKNDTGNKASIILSSIKKSSGIQLSTQSYSTKKAKPSRSMDTNKRSPAKKVSADVSTKTSKQNKASKKSRSEHFIDDSDTDEVIWVRVPRRKASIPKLKSPPPQVDTTTAPKASPQQVATSTMSKAPPSAFSVCDMAEFFTASKLLDSKSKDMERLSDLETLLFKEMTSGAWRPVQQTLFMAALSFKSLVQVGNTTEGRSRLAFVESTASKLKIVHEWKVRKKAKVYLPGFKRGFAGKGGRGRRGEYWEHEASGYKVPSYLRPAFGDMVPIRYHFRRVSKKRSGLVPISHPDGHGEQGWTMHYDTKDKVYVYRNKEQGIVTRSPALLRRAIQDVENVSQGLLSLRSTCQIYLDTT